MRGKLSQLRSKDLPVDLFFRGTLGIEERMDSVAFGACTIQTAVCLGVNGYQGKEDIKMSVSGCFQL